MLTVAPFQADQPSGILTRHGKVTVTDDVHVLWPCCSRTDYLNDWFCHLSTSLSLFRAQLAIPSAAFILHRLESISDAQNTAAGRQAQDVSQPLFCNWRAERWKNDKRVQVYLRNRYEQRRDSNPANKPRAQARIRLSNQRRVPHAHQYASASGG